MLSCLLLACGLLFLLEATLRRSNLLRALRPFAIPLILLALAMVRASPVTGYGLGTYYGNTLFLENSRTFYEHAHNDYLEFTAELGLVGMVPLALLVLSSAVMAVSAMRQRRRRLAKGAGFASSMGILALLIHSLVDFNLQIPANALLFVFMLALGWMARRHDWAREDAEDSAT